MAKYRFEQRLEIVLSILEKGMSISAACKAAKQLGTGYEHVRRDVTEFALFIW